MGCVVTWVMWVRELRGSVGAWVAWVKFLRGLRGLRGSKYFLRGSTFYVGHDFYVDYVSQIYFCVGQFFLRGSKFVYLGLYMGQNVLHGSKFFAWVNFFVCCLTIIY